MNKDLTLLYVHTDEGFIGYGRFGTELARSLRKKGYKVWDADGNPHAPPQQVHHLTTGYDTPPSPTSTVTYVSVPSHMNGYFEGQHVIFCTMWESSKLPENFRDAFFELDTVIVPSFQNLELFSQYHDNVHFMPLGVDPDLWHYTPPPSPDRAFNFFINGRGERKGVDLAFRAFKTVFRDSDKFSPRPQLHMKSLRGHGEYYANDVHHHTGRISPEAEVALYASCHVHLAPSRGEGFGLTPLQAIALGRPTILTNAHGHESFAHLGTAQLSWTWSPSSYFVFGDAGPWWEPDYDELCEAMWDHYKNYDKYQAQAEKNAQVVAEGWTWDDTADRFLELVGDKISAPYTGSGNWHALEHKLFPVVTVRDFYTEIAGRALFFEEGKEYWEVTDVKRTLFDAGLLAPQCLGTTNHGLAEEQVDTMNFYRAQNSHCPTCHQQLNSQPSHADKIFAELLAAR